MNGRWWTKKKEFDKKASSIDLKLSVILSLSPSHNVRQKSIYSLLAIMPHISKVGLWNDRWLWCPPVNPMICDPVISGIHDFFDDSCGRYWDERNLVDNIFLVWQNCIKHHYQRIMRSQKLNCRGWGELKMAVFWAAVLHSYRRQRWNIRKLDVRIEIRK